MTVILRRVELSDLRSVQALVHDSFEEALHPYMISTQAGAEAYLRVFVKHASLSPERQFLLAESASGALLGYAEFRLLEGTTGFLSYICVASDARGQGIATRLLQQYLSDTPEVSTVQLDVFSHNTPARSLYRKLGFIEQMETSWWRMPLPAQNPSDDASLRVDDLPAAVATFEQYGFCELRGTFRSIPFRVGRMGPGVLRCFRAEDLSNDALLSALSVAFPDINEVLAILPAGPSPHRQAQEMNRSVRMIWALPRPAEDI